MNSNAPKILVVDDEPYMHRLMQYHFQRAGYDIIRAFSGREALEKAATEAPQVIIMDVMMAEMDGLAALKSLKELDATRTIPVIMLTASAHALTREESVEYGAAGFVTKPFSPTQLLMEIKRLLPAATAS